MIEMTLEPSIKTMSPDTSYELISKLVPKLGMFMGIFSTLTIAMGLSLIQSLTGGGIPSPRGAWGALIMQAPSLRS